MEAKRHHYVPKFLLNRFSCDPPAESPMIWCLEKESGRTFQRSTNMETVIKHHNRLEYRLEVPTQAATAMAAAGARITWDQTAAEQVLAMIEDLAAPSVVKLAAGQHLSRDERETFALFLWVQFQRTPLGREWTRFAMNKTANLIALKRLSDYDHVRRFFQDSGEQRTMEEVREWCAKTAKELEDGSLIVEATHDHEVLGTFLGADKYAPMIASRMTWVGLQASTDRRFILCDHPLAFYDPSSPPGEPAGWFSSPTVQATLPLDPSFCLRLTPGPATYQTAPADKATVRDVNLRTYAWAHWHVYGPSAAALKKVRVDAKRRQTRVVLYEPRPPRFFLLEGIQGDASPFNVTVDRPLARGSRTRRD